jgi:uncharacterized glyoxalase superfamily protein PhnB
MPRSTIVPVLRYADVRGASDWLCAAFGFTERLRIGEHRIQLSCGDGWLVVREGGDIDDDPTEGGFPTHVVMVRVEDVDAHHERARAHGARILEPPTDWPYGERQYAAQDPAGHRWTFSQTLADVDPATWGGTVGDG